MILTLTILAISLITLCIGILFILSPVSLIKINRLSNRVILKDEIFFRYFRTSGLIQILAGAWFLWVYFTA